MDLPTRFALNNGLQVPSVGLGTFQGDEGNGKVKDAVKLAVRPGYRHIDGASSYDDEKEIGEALKKSGIARDELYTQIRNRCPVPKLLDPFLDKEVRVMTQCWEIWGTQS